MRCKKHDRHNCFSYECYIKPTANLGDITVNTEGNISIGVGSGLAIDPTDGSIGIQFGGITIDTGNSI